MSAPITEAHRKLASKILWECPGVNGISQLIADSEAKAVAQWSGGLDQSLPDLYEAAKAERDELRGALAVAENWVDHHSQHADDLIAQNAELRAEAERLKADGAASAFINMSCRASRAEAELAAERARLDWLEDSSRCYHVCIDRQPDGYSIHNMTPSTGSVRAAIDAAMKEGAKL